MTGKEVKLLSEMKQLIKVGKRKFQNRPDRDYLQDLLDFGITEETAWEEHIIYLNANFYHYDPKPFYAKSDNTLVFIKPINKALAYIKIKMEEENGNKIVVCLSFHLTKNKKGER